MSAEDVLYLDFYTSVAPVAPRVCALALPPLNEHDVGTWAVQLIRVTSADQQNETFAGRGWDQFFMGTEDREVMKIKA
jgi:hypothetical protein